MISQFTTNQILAILDKIRRDLFPSYPGQFAVEQVTNEQCIRFLHELAAYYQYEEARRQQFTGGHSQQPPLPNAGQTGRIQTSTAYAPPWGGTTAATGAPPDAPRPRVPIPRLSRPPRPLASSRYRRSVPTPTDTAARNTVATPTSNTAPTPASNTAPTLASNMVARPATNTVLTPATHTVPAQASIMVPAPASNTVSSTSATQTRERPLQPPIPQHSDHSDGQEIQVLSSAPDSIDLELSATSSIRFARIDEGIERISALLFNLSANDFTKIAPDVMLVATETSGIGPLSQALSEISDEGWWTDLMKFYLTVVIQTESSHGLLKLKNTIWRLNYIELFEFWERYCFFLSLH